jgi:hypothetical protein
MIEFMGEITEAVDEFASEIVENTIIALARMIGKAVILITAPVWILPYKLIMNDILTERKNTHE